MDKKILLLQGGLGAEREVSFNTAKSFQKALKDLDYSFEVLEAKADLPQRLSESKADIVFNALHGKYAEDGTVQAICEYLKIPYTGSGVLASALAMNKIKSKQVLSYEKIATPSFQIINTRNKRAEAKDINISLPFVVKPSREGSSIGISICKEEGQVGEALDLASKYDEEIFIEKYIEGSEITVPILSSKALTPIEIIPNEMFYDYEHKYTKGKTEYLLPPNVRKETLERLQLIAEKSFSVLGMRSYGRIDFIVDKQEQIYFIEANTLPGCTETSLLPKSALYDGIEFKEVVRRIIEDARLDYEGVL